MPGGVVLACAILLAAGCAAPMDSPNARASITTPTPAVTPAPTHVISPTARPSTSPTASTGSTPALVYPTIPTQPTGPELAGDPLSAEDGDGAFVLALMASQDRYRAGQVIDITATLGYLGPDAEAVALGSSHALVGFALEGGEPPISIHPAFTTDCAPHLIRQGAPLVFPFTKSGSTSGSDPDVVFRSAYFSDPVLRLPAGTWTISAGTGFFTGNDCGDELHSLQAEVTITVLP